MNISSKIATFRDLFNADEPLGKFAFSLLLLIIPAIFALVIYAEHYLFVIPVLIVTPLAFLIVVRPKIWLYLVSASLVMFFHAGDTGVGVLDVLLGILYLGSIVIFFVWKGLVKKEKIIENWGDWAILTFFILLIFNFFIAVSNDVVPLNWLREYLLISILLIYFPIRDILRKEGGTMNFLIFLGIIVIFTGTYQMFEYYRKVNDNLVYAYELKNTVSINQTLFTAAAIYGLILAFSQKTKFKEIIIIGMTSLYVVFLVSTFSRTFWMVLAAAVVLMFFLLPAKKKALFMTYIGIISTVVLIAAFLFMRDKADVALAVVFSRFESTSAGRKDPSLIARFREWEKVWYYIQQNPLGGNGLAKQYTFHFPINARARHTIIIHNGFIWLAYRTGIPMALLFIFFLIFYTWKSGKLLKYNDDPINRALIIAAFSTLLSLYIMNMTASLYFYRDGIFVTAFTVALIGVCESMMKNKKNILE